MTSRSTSPASPLPPTDQSEGNTGSTIEPPKRIASPPPILPSITQENGASDTFGFELLELARKQETENEALLHFLSGSTETSTKPESTKPESKAKTISSFNDHKGLNSEALLDDLIPSKDPCYLNMKLRDSSVLLLHSITAESVYSFIMSLAKDCYEIYFGSSTRKSSEKDQEKEGGDEKKISEFNEDEKEMIIEDNWIRIKKSIEKNRNSLCSNARLESQLLVAQHLLEARSRNSSTTTTDNPNYADQIAEEVSIELKELVKTREESIEEGIKIRELISVTGNVFWDKVKIPLLSNP